MMAAFQIIEPTAQDRSALPPMLFWSHYFSDVASLARTPLFDGPLVWDPLLRLVGYLDSWEPEILAGQEAALSYAESLNRREGAIQGQIALAEGTHIEPYVLLRAVGGRIAVGHNVQIQAFTRIEARGGDLVIGDDAQIQAGTDILGSGVIGAGSILCRTLWRGKIGIGQDSVITAATLYGPIRIGDHCNLRAGSLLREYSLFGNHIEFRSEAKHVILLDGARAENGHSSAAHYSYLGDSLIGRDVNLGAGTKISNLKVNRTPISIEIEGRRYHTGLTKFGAVLGNGVQTGCLSVFAPGSLIGPETLIYPGANVRGYCPPRSILKVRQSQEIVRKGRDIGICGLRINL